MQLPDPKPNLLQIESQSGMSSHFPWHSYRASATLAKSKNNLVSNDDIKVKVVGMLMSLYFVAYIKKGEEWWMKASWQWWTSRELSFFFVTMIYL